MSFSVLLFTNNKKGLGIAYVCHGHSFPETAGCHVGFRAGSEFSQYMMYIYLHIYCITFNTCGTFTFSTVPAPLYETLTATGKGIENELSVTQSLAWKYTTVLEKLTNPDSQPGEAEVEMLRQALYNVRQHEAFLKLLMVRERSGQL